MGNIREKTEDNKVAFIFILIPTIMLIIGYFIFPYPPTQIAIDLIKIPMFLGLFSLFVGFLWRDKNNGRKIKIAGWLTFAFFWSIMPSFLYFSEGEDIFNAAVCVIGVYVLVYLAYHEWLSLSRNEEVSCLNWIAGASSIAGIIYFGFEMTPLAFWLREVVSAQSAALLNIFTGNVAQNSIHIMYERANIEIIFACTAVQSLVIFVGIILPLKNIGAKRMAYGLLLTVVPVYFLNLVRNALVIFLVGKNGPEFFPMAHNVIGKVGSLIALIVLLLIVIKVVPEVFDEIVHLTELPKRNGPLEKMFKRLIGRN